LLDCRTARVTDTADAVTADRSYGNERVRTELTYCPECLAGKRLRRAAQ